MGAGVPEALLQGVGAQEVAHPHAPPPGLVLVRGPDAPVRRPDLLGAAQVLGGGLEDPVVRKDEVGPVGHDEVLVDLDAAFHEAVDLALESPGVDYHAVAHDAEDSRVQDSRGHEMQDELLVGDPHRVPRVVTAVVAGHDLDVLREEVDDLSFAFVAPLGAYYDDVGHGLPSARRLLGGGGGRLVDERVAALFNLAEVRGVEGEELALFEALLIDPAGVLPVLVLSEEGAPEEDLAAGPASVALALATREEGGRVLLQDLRLDEAAHLAPGLTAQKPPIGVPRRAHSRKPP